MLVLRRLFGAAIALVLTSGWLLALPERAYAESAISPKSGNFTVRGSGFGHGWGMSQYGAYGAARKGLGWEQILGFYYPGTKLTKMASGTKLRVWVTGDNDGTLRVRPASGLTVSDSNGEKFKVPKGSKYRSWRISRSGSGYKLTYRNSSGNNVSVSTGLSSGTWSFSSSSKIIEVIMPSGSVRPYRGSVALVKRGSSGRTVNRVSLEDYVKGVVASEMPTSWHPEAVRAQTVAARSYAVRIRDFYSYDGYDICDTTACQVYGGINRETSAGNAAVKATNGTIVTYKGAAALTQFASSNGGHSAQGDHPYLAPRPDPYDSVIKSQAWTRTVSAKSIASRWSVGTVKKLQITSRDGAGAWGGRVNSIKIIGSKKTITITGYSFYRAYDLRSRLFTFGGSSATPTPAAPLAAPAVKPGAKYASFPRSYHSGSKVDLTLVNSAGQLKRYPIANGKLGTSGVLGSGFSGYTHVVNAGDWNGDGYQDVIVRRTKKVYLLRGTKTGQLASRVSMGFGGGIRTMTGIGDANGDGRPDLAVITETGNLWLYYGDGRTGRKTKTKISSGWADHDWLRAPGDFDRDGRLDLITRIGDRVLLHRGTKSGFAAPVTLASRWSGVSTIASVGDVTGDGRADVLARTTDGKLVTYAGNGKDSLTRDATLPGSFSGTRFTL